MLNRTTRKQVEKILPQFFDRWPTAQALAQAEEEEVCSMIKFLGFGSTRTKRVINMSKAYSENGWKSVRELPGVGEYATRMWEIFFEGKLGDVEPSDGALSSYWRWRKKLDHNFANSEIKNF